MSPNGVTAPQQSLPRQFDYDDDEMGDRTIPAAALPDEIKNLRAQFAAQRKAAAAPEPSTTTKEKLPAPAPMPPLPPRGRTETGETLSITNRADPRDWEDDEGAKTAIAMPGELPGVLRGKRPTATVKPVPAPAPFNPSAADVARPGDSLPSLTPADDSSFDDLEAVRPQRTGLIVALLVLAALAIAGLLVLLDIIPLPRLRTTQPVGQHQALGRATWRC